MNQRTNKRTKSNDFTLFIGGLPGTIKHKDVFDYFKNRFEGTFKVYLKFKKNGLSAGYGTIKVSNQRSFEKIVKMTHFINNRQIECRPYLSSSNFAKYQKDFYNSRVYVTKIPSNVDNEKLKRIFEIAGEVTKAYIIHDNKPAHLYNFGYVVFKNPKDAIKAVKIQKFSFEDKILLCKKFDQKKKQKLNQNSDSDGDTSENSSYDNAKNTKTWAHRSRKTRICLEDFSYQNMNEFLPNSYDCLTKNTKNYYAEEANLEIPTNNNNKHRHYFEETRETRQNTQCCYISDFLISDSMDRLTSKNTVAKLKKTIKQIKSEARLEKFDSKKIKNLSSVKFSHLSFDGNLQINRPPTLSSRQSHPSPSIFYGENRQNFGYGNY